MLVLDLDARARAHLQRALVAHQQWCRANGHRLPEELAALLAATSGQGRPSLDQPEEIPHHAAMPPAAPLLHTLSEVAERLRLSPRTVRRLTAAGDLPTVRVGSSVRVHHVDLDAFAAGLRREDPTCPDASRPGAA